MIIIGIIIILLLIGITNNQAEIGAKLDEANRLSKQRNEILNRK